jgi:ligand-binding sensor domain-containing protein/serine phosphatase RsbU (regulator of sigma subunit)
MMLIVPTGTIFGLVNSFISEAGKHLKLLSLRKGLLLLSFPFFSGIATSQLYTYRNFSTDEGLAQPYVYSIIQDDPGYLWVGTGNGLYRYNGIIFETFTFVDSLTDNFITSGISDGKYTWFGHMNGGLSCFDGKKFTPYRLDLTSSSPVTHFAKSPDGRIWLSTYSDGLMRIDKANRVLKQNMSKNKVSILTFEFLNDKELLAGTNYGLLFLKLNDSYSIEEIIPVEDIPQSKVTCIRKIRGRSGFYIVTENEGIFQLTRENNLFKVSEIITDQDFEISGIQDVIEDSRSNLWIGSLGSGLFKVILSESGKLLEIDSLNISSGFTTDNVKTVFEDSEGNIWSGNYGNGLTQIIPKTFSCLKFDVSLYKEIHSICRTDHYLWVGTETGLVKIDTLSGTAVRFYSKEFGFGEDIITALCSIEGREIWIGTEKNGLFRMNVEKEKIFKFPLGDDALENSITSVAGKGNQICAGTKKGLCIINVASNSVRWYSINQGGLPHNYINSLYVDGKGRVWVTTHSNSLACIEYGKVTRKPINTGAGVLMLGQITEDSDSRIWVGSAGNGLFLIGSDTITNITVKEGLLSNYCYSLISDDRKNIWVGHKGGLSRIATTDFSIKPFQHIEGVSDNYQFNSSISARDLHGKIWFCADKGIVSYDPSMDFPSVKPPVLTITSLWINDELREYADRITLSPGIYKIRIDYLAISLKESELVSYQYKLDGYDQWSEVTKSTSVSYNHLTEGNYSFILKASNGDGVVTEKPLIFNFIIKKPVWKKGWFYLIVLSLLFMLTLIYIKRREQKFLLEKSILEAKVRERTFEIQYQKNEIELQRDIINEKNNNITSSIKSASKIQNAVLTPIELIDKLLPDNFILNMPKDIVSGDFYWVSEKDGKIVFAVADCTGHGVQGAFMSLLGITLLNDIVNIQGITRSDSIVTKLREGVINSLQQSRKEIPTSDGMDISLCVLDLNKNIIQFTGGMNDIVYIRDRKIEIVKADRLSVCLLLNHSGPFTKQEIECRKGDVFYLFSDGYQDQFGGDFDKKFLRQHFYLKLLEIHQLPMIQQKEILENKLLEWIGTNFQTDDVTVMGIRF